MMQELTAAVAARLWYLFSQCLESDAGCRVQSQLCPFVCCSELLGLMQEVIAAVAARLWY